MGPWNELGSSARALSSLNCWASPWELIVYFEFTLLSPCVLKDGPYLIKMVAFLIIVPKHYGNYFLLLEVWLQTPGLSSPFVGVLFAANRATQALTYWMIWSGITSGPGAFPPPASLHSGGGVGWLVSHSCLGLAYAAITETWAQVINIKSQLFLFSYIQSCENPWSRHCPFDLVRSFVVFIVRFVHGRSKAPPQLFETNLTCLCPRLSLNSLCNQGWSETLNLPASTS